MKMIRFQCGVSSEMFLKGALDRVLEKCVGYLENGKDVALLDEASKEKFIETARKLGSTGLRG